MLMWECKGPNTGKGFARFAWRVLVVDVPHTCIFLTEKDIASAVQCFLSCVDLVT